MPHFQVHIGHWLASVHVYDLVVNDSVDAVLSLPDILANVLAADVVRALGDVWGEDAAGVVAKDRCFVRG